jgi:biopolymer transport protein ExbD/biopolymer transport protein TolR
MIFKSWQKQNTVEHEVNMTPLIDVSLVLVVMLLLATPLAFESSIGVRNEKTTAKEADKQEQVERIEIVVVDDRIVRVNESDVLRERLTDTLEPMIASSSDRTVMIGCEEGIRHGTFVDVLDQAKVAGAAAIAVFER